jgi:RimK family alpha-L-glutamate ligase
MKIAVMHPSATPPPSCREIMYEAKRLGARSIYLRPQDVTALFSGRSLELYRGAKRLDSELVFVRGTSSPSSIEQFTWMTNIVKLIEDGGGRAINSYSSIVLARDKSMLPSILGKRGVSFPRTYVTNNLQAALTIVGQLGKAVVKPIIGSLGRGVMLLDNEDVAYSILKQLLAWGQPLLLQEYIDKKDNRDIRALVINGEVFAAYYRKARPGHFKTNLAQGGTPEKAELTGEIEEIAISTAEALGLFYGGIDIAESSSGQLFVLEANASPNWKGAEAMGLNPARKLVEEALKTGKA